MRIFKMMAVLSAMLLCTRVYAVPCSQTDTGVFLSNTTTAAWSNCADGAAGDGNEGTTTLNIFGMTYSFLQKYDWDDNTTTTTVPIGLTAGPPGAQTSGTWSFTNVAAYNQYVIVLNDGGAFPNPNTPPVDANDAIKWSAYLLDSTPFSSATDSTWSGDWIYGYNSNGSLKEISHLSVFAKLDDNGGGGEEEIPVPGTLLLVGLGILGLRFRSKA